MKYSSDEESSSSEQVESGPFKVVKKDDNISNLIIKDEAPPPQTKGKYMPSSVVAPDRKISSREINPAFNKNGDLGSGKYLVGDGGKKWRENVEKSKRRIEDEGIIEEKENPRAIAQREKEERIAKQKALRRKQRLEEEASRCYYCFNNKKIPSHLIITLGNFSYLTFVEKGQLVKFHVNIVPFEHVPSITAMEDDTFAEIYEFMNSLTQLFKSINYEAIFIETVTSLGAKRHTCIECIPIPQSHAKSAPSYFRKALTESESDWSQHKKVIDFDVRRGIRKTVPEKFEYFMVQFGMKTGMAHVIESQKDFSKLFGKEVIAGILKLPIERYVFKQERKSVEEEKKQVSEFLEHWIKFDWTVKLDGGSY